jgi:hypothetical protein
VLFFTNPSYFKSSLQALSEKLGELILCSNLPGYGAQPAVWSNNSLDVAVDFYYLILVLGVVSIQFNRFV